MSELEMWTGAQGSPSGNARCDDHARNIGQERPDLRNHRIEFAAKYRKRATRGRERPAGRLVGCAGRGEHSRSADKFFIENRIQPAVVKRDGAPRHAAERRVLRPGCIFQREVGT